MNWMNNYCIKTYSHSNSSIISSDMSSSSLARSWIFSLDDSSFKSFSKSGFNMWSNMSLSPSNARKYMPHVRVAKIEHHVEHVNSTTRPFVGINKSIMYWKKCRNFLYGPLQGLLDLWRNMFFSSTKVKSKFLLSNPVPKHVDFGCLMDFMVVKSLTKTWATNAGVYKKI